MTSASVTAREYTSYGAKSTLKRWGDFDDTIWVERMAYRRSKRLGVSAIAFAMLTLAPAAAATVSGTLPQPGVVWISDDSKPAALPESQMRNKDKSFVPNLLVVTAGSDVRFPNDDEFFHSIYSSSGSDPFDVGFYDSGPGKVIAFPRSGVNEIRCHIHGAMHATIVVVDGPWRQTTQPGEAYRIEGVRPGRHVLHTWTPAGGEQKSEVRL